MSRGFGNAELGESVVRLAGGQADVGPALAAAAAGEYTISLFPLDNDTPDQPPATVHWEPGKAAMVPASGLAPGLMKIALVADGTPISIAWVLVADSANYAPEAKKFGEAWGVVSQWLGATHAQASRSVLRAYLKVLSTSEPRP